MPHILGVQEAGQSEWESGIGIPLREPLLLARSTVPEG